MAHCAYCNPNDEIVLWQGPVCRVVLVNEPGFSGWCRVIWTDHRRELSDLSEGERAHLMSIVAGVERALIAHLNPAKMNIAALGTAAPHLHFHVIPRFPDDPTFPDPVWVARKRDDVLSTPEGLAEKLSAHFSETFGNA